MKYSKIKQLVQQLANTPPVEDETSAETPEREKMKLYSFNAPESLMNELKQESIKNMVPMSAMIRASIQQLLIRVKE